MSHILNDIYQKLFFFFLHTHMKLLYHLTSKTHKTKKRRRHNSNQNSNPKHLETFMESTLSFILELYLNSEKTTYTEMVRE